MRAAVAAVTALGLIACGKSPEVDCKALLDDPAHGFERVANTSDDPAQIWATFERCFAPDGDTCARAAVGGAMVPSMAISDGSQGAAARAEQWRRWAERCRTLPSDQQRCLMVSYAIGHPECQKVADEVREKLR